MSAVHIILICFIPFTGTINSINWPAPNVWVFIAQLVEHCSANAKAMGGRYFLQVAGCRLKFHYNWKTAGSKKKGKAIDLP